MGRRTPLYETHLSLQGRIVDFGGWDMPVQYRSVLDEHHAVRRHAGVFDVSHMTFLEVTGTDAAAWLGRLLANDIASLNTPGKALYSAMLNEQGGILDDLIVYAPVAQDPHRWRVIVNCATHDKDLAWMQQQIGEMSVSIEERTDIAMLAVQGPNARQLAAQVLGGAKAEVIGRLEVFQGDEVEGWFIARTGYTGEDGLEIQLPAEAAPAFLLKLVDAGVTPCGLGARDTLRLEAGMNLYGSDMTEATSPLVSNMAWTVRWDHDFTGKDALLAERTAGPASQLVGLVLEGKGVLRSHMKVLLADGREGETTSGTYSPTLERAIALARLPVPVPASVEVEIRGKKVAASVIKPPFVRQGKALV